MAKIGKAHIEAMKALQEAKKPLSVSDDVVKDIKETHLEFLKEHSEQKGSEPESVNEGEVYVENKEEVSSSQKEFQELYWDSLPWWKKLIIAFGGFIFIVVTLFAKRWGYCLFVLIWLGFIFYGKTSNLFYKGAKINNTSNYHVKKVWKRVVVGYILLFLLPFIIWISWEGIEQLLTKQVSTESMQPVREITVGNIRFNMILVKGGTFIHGEPESDNKWFAKEAPCHNVTLSDFYIGECEVTQALWEEVMGENPSKVKKSDCPVTNVSWNDVQDFIRRLNGKTSLSFRLPTDAEWVYAARGGEHREMFKYSGSDELDEVAWNKYNSDGVVRAVKGKRPNSLGIYDMSGNVMEWCQDWYAPYGPEALNNPQGPADGKYKVGHGGAWKASTMYCQPSIRAADYPWAAYDYLGFRLVLDISGKRKVDETESPNDVALNDASQEPIDPIQESASDFYYKYYHNSRFDFEIYYPSFFDEIELPTNGDGCKFIRDEQTYLIAAGINNVFDETLEDKYKECKAKQPVYCRMKNDWLVVSDYTEDGRIYYEKTVLRNGAFLTATLYFPPEEKPFFAEIIPKIFTDFPGK